ncbi:MAG: tetratricopeptide repeat protein, partial [Campylobacter ureolyticus]
MKKVIVLLSFVCAVLLGNELEIADTAYEAGDYQKAFKYSKTACDNGEYRSCFNLGLLYNNGQGVEQNYNEAFKYYKLACNNGKYRGCFNLGGLYVNG